jgi:hypothetical protein
LREAAVGIDLESGDGIGLGLIIEIYEPGLRGRTDGQENKTHY